jgi:hypothetical protein
VLPWLLILFESNENFVWSRSAWLCSTCVIYMLLCFFFVRGNWVMRDLFFLYFHHVRVCGSGVHAVWIEIWHLKFFCFGFLLGFLINWLCAIRVCSKVRWSNWLLLWQFTFCLWSLISPLMYGICGSILVYFHFYLFFEKSVILVTQCLICYWNSQIRFLLPLLSWLCGMVWNSVCYFPYTANQISTLLFLVTSHFLMCFTSKYTNLLRR